MGYMRDLLGRRLDQLQVVAVEQLLHVNLPDRNSQGHPASLTPLIATGLQFVQPGVSVEAGIAALDAAIAARTTNRHATLTDLASSGHAASIISFDPTNLTVTQATQVQQALVDIANAVAAGGGGDPFTALTADTPALNSGTEATPTTLRDTGLSVNVAANGIYELRSNIFYDTGTTGDLKLKWVGPTGATLSWQSNGMVTGTTGTSANIDKAMRSITSSPGVGGAGTGVVVSCNPSGLLRVGSTAGVFKLQYGQNATDSVTTLVKADSHFVLKKVG